MVSSKETRAADPGTDYPSIQQQQRHNSINSSEKGQCSLLC